MLQYQKPFRVESGRISDKNGTEVKLWGVNYYAPFNHNYYNLEEMGVDHLRAIDRDIADFKRMGINFVRMHIYDREISDIEGHLVDNHHLEVFDYLIERLFQEDIYVMITPIVWYNSVALQKSVTDGYAYWNAGAAETFGFSNLYQAHEMIWNEKALSAQCIYLNEFFAHVNRFGKKRLDEYEHVAIIEVTNEAIYPTDELISELRKADKTNPFKKQEAQLVELYDQYLAERSLESTKEEATKYCANLVLSFLNRTFRIVDCFFGETIIKTHIFYHFEEKEFFEMLDHAPINAVSITAYTPNHFDTGYHDDFNVLEELRRLRDYYTPLKKLKKAFICYEFDMPTTLTNYSFGAFAYMLASFGAQAAAYFTYTPVDVSEYNPGWIVHYLNFYHTPKKAVSLAAGARIFKETKLEELLPQSDVLWESEQFTVDKEMDLVVYQNEDCFFYSESTEVAVKVVPKEILGSGNCMFLKRNGNGILILIKRSDEELSLTVLPNQKFVNDPFRGKSFRNMANRYVNTNTESVVSRLIERPDQITVNYPGFETFEVIACSENKEEVLSVTNNTFSAFPGKYRICKKG